MLFLLPEFDLFKNLMKISFELFHGLQNGTISTLNQEDNWKITEMPLFAKKFDLALLIDVFK